MGHSALQGKLFSFSFIFPESVLVNTSLFFYNVSFSKDLALKLLYNSLDESQAFLFFFFLRESTCGNLHE